MWTVFLAPYLCLQANAQPGRMDFLKLTEGVGPIGWAVLALLFLMSVWSFGVMLDRAFLYSAVRRQSRRFVQQVAGPLREGNLEEAIRIAERNSKSHIAKVTASGLSEFQLTGPRRDSNKTMEAIQRTLGRSAAIVHAELERGLASLATIGATAPFVGLFGTVVGILTAFKKIADTNATGLPAVAGGISEALIATALGLLVAIPAVWAFNAFTNQLKFFGVEMENSSMELVNYFLTRLEEKP